ncbi:MAG: dihydrodipicolinate synthase family protein [Acidobacteriota bacterium]
MRDLVSKIRGVVTALGTPLDSAEDLHEEGMREQVRMQLRAGVNGLLVTGSMGAMQLLKDETYEKSVAVAADEADGSAFLIVGCGDTSLERTAARIRRIESFAVDAVALVPPFFFRFTDAELFDYFKQLSESSQLPIFLYDNPTYTKHSLNFELVVELSKLPKIIGLKGSGDFLTFRKCAEYFRECPDFAVVSGQTPFLDVSLQFGARGIVDGLFAVAPELGVRIWESFCAGDFRAMTQAQSKIMKLLSIIQVDSIFAGFTAAMNARGIPGNFAIKPFAPLTPEGRRTVEGILRQLELRQAASAEQG